MRAFDLFTEMNRLHRELDRALPTRELETLLRPALRPVSAYPQFRVLEDEKGYTVEALIPGVEAEELQIVLEKGALTISGERKDRKEEGKELRRERGTGSFRKTVTLPAQIEADGISAEYRNGVLTVTVPKAEAAKPRRIEVSAG